MLVSSDFLAVATSSYKANRAKIVYHTLKNSVTIWEDKVIIL